LSCQNPLETVGDADPALAETLPAGILISLKALAPKLSLLANGWFAALAGPSSSSIAFSSNADEAAEETDAMEPLLRGIFVCNRGGDVPVTFDILIRRRLFACCAADVMGPG
jgi:hypothetical protein